MKIINNEIFIQRNKKISQAVLYTSLAFLGIGLFWSISSPNVTQMQLSYLVLIPAYILVQVSIYMANRWSRSPRPDEIVAQSLKGLPDDYTLYNYSAGVPHLLAGPAGLWLIKPYYHSGEIIYDEDKQRFKQKGGPFIISKLFAQESLPDILHDSQNLRRRFRRYLENNDLDLQVQPDIVNIFYSEKANVIANKAPEPIMHAEKLKNFIRKKSKEQPLNSGQLREITALLPQPE